MKIRLTVTLSDEVSRLVSQVAERCRQSREWVVETCVSDGLQWFVERLAFADRLKSRRGRPAVPCPPPGGWVSDRPELSANPEME